MEICRSLIPSMFTYICMYTYVCMYVCSLYVYVYGDDKYPFNKLVSWLIKAHLRVNLTYRLGNNLEETWIIELANTHLEYLVAYSQSHPGSLLSERIIIKLSKQKHGVKSYLNVWRPSRNKLLRNKLTLTFEDVSLCIVWLLAWSWAYLTIQG